MLLPLGLATHKSPVVLASRSERVSEAPLCLLWDGARLLRRRERLFPTGEDPTLYNVRQRRSLLTGEAFQPFSGGQRRRSRVGLDTGESSRPPTLRPELFSDKASVLQPTYVGPQLIRKKGNEREAAMETDDMSSTTCAGGYVRYVSDMRGAVTRDTQMQERKEKRR